MKKFDYKKEIIERIGQHISSTISPLLNCTISIAMGSDLKINQTFSRSGYCEYLVETKKCSAQCEQVRDDLNEKILSVKNTIVMTCPFGIVKIVVPIKLKNKVIGAIFCCGNFKSKLTQEQLEINVEKYNLDKDEYIKHIEELDTISNKSLKTVAKSIEKNCSLITEILYNNYLLENISKRETCLREISKMVHDLADSGSVVFELVNHLSKIFDINRIMIVEKKPDGTYEKDDYICGRNVHLEHWSTEEYENFYKYSYDILNKTKSDIAFINSEKVLSQDNQLTYFVEYWKKSNLSSITVARTKQSDGEHLMLYIRSNDDEVWTDDELDFFICVSDQINIAYKLTKDKKNND